MKTRLSVSAILFLCATLTYSQCLFQAPFTESFDTNTTPACWTNGGWHFADVNTVNFPAPNAGAAGIDDHTGNGGYFTWRDVSVSNSVSLTTPSINDSGISTLGVAFWYYIHSPTAPSQLNPLYIDFYDGSNWNLQVASVTSNSPYWKYATIDLSTYNTTGPVKLRFRNVRYNIDQDLLVDDIFVGELPSCQPQFPLSVASASAQQAMVQVGSNISGTYQYKLTPRNMPALSIVTDTASTDSIVLQGLQPNNAYSLYVRKICSPGDTSDWNHIDFSTICGTYTAPFSESFDNFGNPSCWESYSQPGGAPFVINYNIGFDHTNNGGYGVGSNFSFANVEAILQTPAIDISGLNQPYLSFWQNFTTNKYDHTSVPVAHLRVEASVDTLNWFPVDSFGVLNPNWQFSHTSLANLGLGDTLFLRLVFRTFNSQMMGVTPRFYIDDLKVGEKPSCLSSDSLYISNISSSTATVNLLQSNDGYIEWGTAPLVHGNGAVATINDSLVLSNLQGGTWYSVYFRDSCITGTAEWSRPYHFRTPCPQQFVPEYRESFNDLPQNDTSFSESCWTSYSSGNTFWTAGLNTTTNLTGPGPLFDQGFVYTEANSGSPGDLSYLESPWIDLSQNHTPYLTYHYYMYGSDIGNLCVEAYSNGQWDSIPNYSCFSGQQQPNDNQPWYRATVPLDHLSGLVKIRFKAERGGGIYGDIALDAVRIFDTCVVSDPVASFTSSLDSVTLSGAYYTFTSTASGATEYYWDFGTGIMDTGTVVQYVFNSNGPYTVQHLALNKCGITDTASDTITVQGVSLKERSLAGLQVYPNPSSNVFHLQLNSDLDATATLYDLKGQKLQETLLIRGVGILNPQGNIPPGMYVVQVTDEGGNSLSKKVILQE